MTSALDTLLEIKKLILSDSLPEDEKDELMTLVSSLKSSLESRGHTYSGGEDNTYTVKRAQELLKISNLLLVTLDKSSSYSASDKAVTLSAVSNSYLQIAHAFKVDSKVWKVAQSDLVPTVSSAVDEKSLDLAISCLRKHLNAYMKSLNKWL